jgi:hypothetical protein
MSTSLHCPKKLLSSFLAKLVDHLHLCERFSVAVTEVLEVVYYFLVRVHERMLTDASITSIPIRRCRTSYMNLSIPSPFSCWHLSYPCLARIR